MPSEAPALAVKQLQRTSRAQESPDSPDITFRDIAHNEDRDRAVGCHLFGAAVGEERVAGEHAPDKVPDDCPADHLHDNAGGSLWPDRLRKQHAESCPGDGAGDAPQQDDDEHSPDEAALATSLFWEDTLLKFDGGARDAELNEDGSCCFGLIWLGERGTDCDCA